MKKLTSLLLSCIVLLAIVPVNALNNQYSGSATISLLSEQSNEGFIMSAPMTFTEMVERYAQNAGISYQDALAYFPASPTGRTARDANYRVFSRYLSVTDIYKPHIEFFCETVEGGHFCNITSIYSVQLVRIYNGVSKQFQGDLQAWLRSSTDIEYVINGDFYNNGETSISSTTGGSIGIDGLFSVTFNVVSESSLGHYAAIYDHATIQYGA